MADDLTETLAADLRVDLAGFGAAFLGGFLTGGRRAGRPLVFGGMSATTLASPAAQPWQSDRDGQLSHRLAGVGEIGAWQAVRAVRAVRAYARPSVAIGGITEAAWISAHLLLYPWGTRREVAAPIHHRVDDFGPVARGRLVGNVANADVPVLLVHGLVDNRSVFTVLRRALGRRGFGHVLTMNYSVFTQDVRQAALELGSVVERLCDRTGHDRIHVIGHSLGGLVARYYVQRLGGDVRVASLVTLGTPHGGTAWSRFAPRWLPPASIIAQLRPDSPVLGELEQPAPTCQTSILAVYSDLDQLVVPAQAGRCEHPDLDVMNVMVRGIGHMSLPVDPRVARIVAEHLRRADHTALSSSADVRIKDPRRRSES